jgi:hypothetical protein
MYQLCNDLNEVQLVERTAHQNTSWIGKENPVKEYFWSIGNLFTHSAEIDANGALKK